MSYDFIPYASSAGGSMAGSELGPQVLKDLNWDGLSQPVQWVNGVSPDPDAAHLPPAGSEDRLLHVVQKCQDLCDHVAESIARGDTPVTLGGDHSMAIGSVSGLAQAKQAHGKIGLIWLDAHMDSHTFETTPSKNIHGMPVACLLGYGDVRLTSIGGAKPKVSPEHVCIIGARSYEDGEETFLKEMGVNVFYMHDIKEHGIEKIAAQVMDIVVQGTDAVALSLDLDVLDPGVAQGFACHEPGGLSDAQLYDFLKIVRSKAVLDLIEVTEYNPERDTDGRTKNILQQSLAIMMQPV